MAFRYQRPARPHIGLRLQSRDRAALAALADHRYLLARQVHALLFERSSRRVCQQRLRLLFDHGFVERLARPALGGSVTRPGAVPEPVYALSPMGARLVAEEGGRSLADVPSVRSLSVPGWQTLDHDLVIADLLVALAVACRARADVCLERLQSEFALRRQVATAVEGGIGKDQIVPDGAFTLRYTTGPPVTFLVEVVRADLKGGNDRLRQKLERYVRLHHAGHFGRVFGIERLRAVLILTTSTRRVIHFATLARSLAHGRRLFWFGCYRDESGVPSERSAFTPTTILEHRWQSADGDSAAFISTAPCATAPERDTSLSPHV